MNWKHNKITDYLSKNINNKDWGKWTYTAKGANETAPWPNPPTESEMIRDALSRTEDEGFFGDMVAWLKKDAPRRLKSVLRDLCSPMGTISYERLCASLYNVGFRASERLERRMTLGPSNEWIRKYFEDFPPASQRP